MKRTETKRHGRRLCLCAAISILIVSGLIVTIQPNHAFESKEDKVSLASKTDIQAPGIPAIDEAVPSKIETASFGLGWFWGVESQFGIIEGVIRTRVGYAGGQMSVPSYKKMGDHTETIQVDYDPDRISYSQLLDFFWQSHRPQKRSWSQQYMRAVFYHDKDQRLQAEASKVALAEKIGDKVETKVMPLRSFTMAEDYHQKYLLKGHGELKGELVRIYPSHRDLVDSTAAARLNGYAGGHGNKAQLSREITRLGLSTSAREILIELVQK